MQIATLSYRYKPNEKGNADNRAKLLHRQILTTVTSPTKKIKQRRSVRSDLTGQSNGQLPPINQRVPRRTSIRIQGSSLPSSKLGDTSAFSFHHQSRSHSRLSNKSDQLDGRSRSVGHDRRRRNVLQIFMFCLEYTNGNDETIIESSSIEIWISSEITYTGFLCSRSK